MNFNPDAKKTISSLVEAWGGNPDTFWDQKADSYEFALAAVSSESLEQFYSQLFDPAETDASARLKSPPWPPKTARAGQLPSERLLGKIRARFNSDKTFDGLSDVSQFMDAFRQKCGSLPIGEQKGTLDSLTTLLGQELMKAKLGGVPVAAQLKAVDRLLTKEQMERESQNQAVKKAQKERDQQLKVQQLEQGNRRLKILEDREAKSRQVISNTALSPEEKEAEMRRILGMT